MRKQGDELLPFLQGRATTGLALLSRSCDIIHISTLTFLSYALADERLRTKSIHCLPLEVILQFPNLFITEKEHATTLIISRPSMNWTEGNLARHSRKRKHKDEFLRQREHFAKVRSGLLNPKTSISPPSISLFAQAPYSISHASSYAVQTMPPTSSRKRSRDAILSEDSQFFTNINVELPDPASFQKEQAEIEALSRKRQKLLMKSDWVGTDLQTPIQLEFSKPRTSLGNPWGSARSSCHSSQQKFRHLLGLNANNDQAVAAKAVTKNAMPVSRGQLKIRVGAREKMLGGSSSISPRSRSYRDVDAISNRMFHVS